jgi:hypothetical protein
LAFLFCGTHAQWLSEKDKVISASPSPHSPLLPPTTHPFFPQRYTSIDRLVQEPSSRKAKPAGGISTGEGPNRSGLNPIGKAADSGKKHQASKSARHKGVGSQVGSLADSSGDGADGISSYGEDKRVFELVINDGLSPRHKTLKRKEIAVTKAIQSSEMILKRARMKMVGRTGEELVVLEKQVKDLEESIDKYYLRQLEIAQDSINLEEGLPGTVPTNLLGNMEFVDRFTSSSSPDSSSSSSSSLSGSKS